jgi:hypothetical protein
VGLIKKDRATGTGVSPPVQFNTSAVDVSSWKERGYPAFLEELGAAGLDIEASTFPAILVATYRAAILS